MMRVGPHRSAVLLALLAGPSTSRGAALDAQHLKLEIALDEPRRSIVGRATETLRSTGDGLSAIELAADEMKVSSVRSPDGQPLAFQMRPPVLSVTLPRPLRAGEEVTITIEYGATPRRGLHFVGPSRERPRLARQVWTQSWPDEARYWFPCPRDPVDKVTSELVLDTPASYEAVANGVLVGARSASGRTVRHWSLDKAIAPYLIAFVAGEYEAIRAETAAPPISLAYFVYRGRSADARKTFGRTAEILRFFSDLVAFPYPYATYSQAVVADFPYEGMENPTAVTLSDSVLRDERARLDGSSDMVIAHEAAHQWWGDIVTPRAPRDLWLSEGLATFFDRLWLEHDAGADAASYQRLRDRDAVLASVGDADADADAQGSHPVVFEDPEDPASTLGTNVYQKSALVLDLLRRSLGEDAFWNGLRGYLHRFAFGVADTADFRRALEGTSGRDLGPFFATWLLQPGLPAIQVSERWDGANVVLAFRRPGSALGGRLSCPLPVEVRIVTATGARDERLEIDRSEETASFVCETPPLAVVVDPDARLPARLDQPRSPASLRVSLARGASAAERAQAARGLGRVEPGAARPLAEALQREPFWGVRAEIAAALGRIGGAEGFDALDAAVRDRDPRVRAAALAAAAHMPPARAEAVLTAAVDRENSDLALGSALRALGAVGSPRAFQALARGLQRRSHADRVRIAALAGLASLQDLRAVPLALAQLSEGNAAIVRISAVATLRALGRGQRVVSARLTALLEDDDARVRGAAAEALGALRDPRARGHLREALGMEPVSAVRRQMSQAIERIEAAQ